AHEVRGGVSDHGPRVPPTEKIHLGGPEPIVQVGCGPGEMSDEAEGDQPSLEARSVKRLMAKSPGEKSGETTIKPEADAVDQVTARRCRYREKPGAQHRDHDDGQPEEPFALFERNPKQAQGSQY